LREISKSSISSYTEHVDVEVVCIVHSPEMKTTRL